MRSRPSHPSSPRPRLRGLGRVGLAAAGVAMLVAAACGPVRLVSSYDPAIDKGMTSYYATMDAFLSEMARKAAQGDPTASYSANVRFYEENGAKVDSLIMRARAAEPKANCIGSDAVDGLAQRLLGFKSFTTGIDGLDVDQVVTSLKTGSGGSCTVQILTAVRANQDITQEIHRRNDKLTAPVVNIIRPTIEQGVRIAVTTELAKKRGEES